MGLFDRRVKHNDIIKNDDPGISTGENEVSAQLNRILAIENSSVSTFYACIELISNSLAAIPIEIKDKQTKEVLSDSPLNTIFSTNNIPKFLLIKQLISDAYKHGNGFAYIRRNNKGQPVELVYRPFGSVSVNYNPVTRKLHYIDTAMSKSMIESVNMIHIRKDTVNGVNGKSLSDIAQQIIDLSKSTILTAKDYMDAGFVSGILSTEKPVSPEQRTQALKEWHRAFDNPKANNIGVLGFGFQYQGVSNNANDSQLIQSRTQNDIEICRYFNVNPILIGINGGSSYSNTLEQAQLDLVIHALNPWLSILEEEFNNKLILPSEKNRIYIDFNEDAILFASKVDTANYYSTLVKNGLISINEARRAMNYAPKEGMDENIIPYTNINDNKVDTGKENKEDGEETKETDVKDEDK